jgi:transcriptional regulator NrdR family protein
MVGVIEMNMPCPKCGGKTRTVDTRLHDTIVKRRRECIVCRHKFYTKEVIMAQPVKVTPKTKRQLEYDALFAKYRLEDKK